MEKYPFLKQWAVKYYTYAITFASNWQYFKCVFLLALRRCSSWASCWSAVSGSTTLASCPSSRRWWSAASPTAGSSCSSPRRPLPWASTCPPAPSSLTAFASTMASSSGRCCPQSTFRWRAGPAGGASTPQVEIVDQLHGFFFFLLRNLFCLV